MRKENCPDNCRYRSHDAPFCGYCMKKILEEGSEKRMGMDKQTVRTMNRLIDMKVDTEKKLTALTIQDILSMQGVTVSEIHIITELQDAVKKHKVISYLGQGTDDLPKETEKEDEFYGQEGKDY